MRSSHSVVVAGRWGLRAAKGSAFAEHALEDRINVLEMIAQVELLGYLAIGEIFLHLGVFFQKLLEIAFATPHRHRVALHELVGVLAAGALLLQRHHEPRRLNEAAEPVAIFHALFGIAPELLGHARYTIEGRIH